MERSRLKNIIILILAILNICLLGALLGRTGTEQATLRQTHQQLIDLFAANGVTLDSKVISSETPPPSLALSRSIEQDKALSAVFLGNSTISTDQGGGIYTYGNDTGAALFRSNGSFDIFGSSLAEDGTDTIQIFCREYHYEDLIFDLDETGTGTAIATRYYNDNPVFNCSVTFTLENGVLSRVSGTYLPSSSSEVNTAAPLSAVAALTTFLDMRLESGSVASVITDMYLCYELQSTTASPMTLTPCWCIVTDTSNYYVNCVTSAVLSE